MDAAEHRKDWPEGEDVTPAMPPRRRIGEPKNDLGRAARWAAWQAEHAGAIEAWNGYVEEQGLPLAEHRLF